VNPSVVSSPGTSALLRHARILLVEDDDIVRDLVACFLDQAGFPFSQAIDGPSGLRLYQEEGPFDLVICDLLMPGMTGVELAFDLRAKGAGCEFLFISAYVELADAKRHFQAQNWRWIAKPFGPVELMGALHEVLGEAE